MDDRNGRFEEVWGNIQRDLHDDGLSDENMKILCRVFYRRGCLDGIRLGIDSLFSSLNEAHGLIKKEMEEMENGD